MKAADPVNVRPATGEERAYFERHIRPDPRVLPVQQLWALQTPPAEEYQPGITRADAKPGAWPAKSALPAQRNYHGRLRVFVPAHGPRFPRSSLQLACEHRLLSRLAPRPPDSARARLGDRPSRWWSAADSP